MLKSLWNAAIRPNPSRLKKTLLIVCFLAYGPFLKAGFPSEKDQDIMQFQLRLSRQVRMESELIRKHLLDDFTNISRTIIQQTEQNHYGDFEFYFFAMNTIRSIIAQDDPGTPKTRLEYFEEWLRLQHYALLLFVDLDFSDTKLPLFYCKIMIEDYQTLSNKYHPLADPERFEHFKSLCTQLAQK